MNTCGIYKIRNTVNGKVIIGCRKQSIEQRKLTSERRKGIRTTPIGYVRSEESNRKQSISMMGKPAWNKGRTGVYSPETIAKIKQARAIQTLRSQLNKESAFIISQLQEVNHATQGK